MLTTTTELIFAHFATRRKSLAFPYYNINVYTGKNEDFYFSIFVRAYVTWDIIGKS